MNVLRNGARSEVPNEARRGASMHELTIQLTDAERRRVDLAAAAMGKTPEQLVADELRYRFGMLIRAADVIELRGAIEDVNDGCD